MSELLRVLQIEDSESDAALIVRALEKARYQVEWERVEDAAGMRAALAERPWDVIIADYYLPQFDAPAALRILRDSGRDIPFIVVSARMGEDTAVEMMKSGAHDYLLKDKLARLGPAVERELRDVETRRERRRAEEALAASEARFRALLESAPQSVVAVDECGRVVLVNARTEEIFGYTRDELLGKPLEIMLPERFRRAHHEHLHDYFSRPYSPAMGLGIDLCGRSRNGAEFPLEVSLSLIEQGGSRLAMALITDITERKHTEESLRESEERHRLLAETMLQGVVHQDAGGKVIAMNPAAERILGTTREEFLGSTSVLEARGAIREDGSPFPGLEHPSMVALRTGKPIRGVVMGVSNPREGVCRWISIDAVPVFGPGKTSASEVYTVFEDITERKRVEEVLRESELRLRTLSDNLPEGAIYRYSQDVHGEPHVDFISAGIERITGVPAAEFMADAATVNRYVVPEDRDRLNAAIALSREQMTQFEVEVRHIHRATGETRWSLMRSTPTRHADGSTTWDGIELDITERRRVDEALRESQAKLAERTLQLELTAAELDKHSREVERVNQMKTEFLARCSHELRTPLNAIVGYSELLAEQSAGPLPPPYPRFVGNIQEGARHLLEMVNDLLDISRIEAGRIDLNREVFRAADALEEVLSVITPLANIKSIAIENQVPPGMCIRADRTRFKQVLYNLLSNAVKFTPENGRVWIAGATCEDAAGFCVGDTGIGIPESELEAVFDEFHQVGGPTRPATEGTGLGLAITRRLVELHGGSIRVESAIGQGSRFIISLGPLSGYARN